MWERVFNICRIRQFRLACSYPTFSTTCPKSLVNFIFFFSPLSLLFLVSCTKYNYKSSTNGSSENISQDKPISGSFNGVKNSSFLRKSNLETLALGRNRMEIEKMMGPPDGRSLDGGNGYLWDYRRPVLDDITVTLYSWSLIS